MFTLFMILNSNPNLIPFHYKRSTNTLNGCIFFSRPGNLPQVVLQLIPPCRGMAMTFSRSMRPLYSSRRGRKCDIVMAWRFLRFV